MYIENYKWYYDFLIFDLVINQPIQITAFLKQTYTSFWGSLCLFIFSIQFWLHIFFQIFFQCLLSDHFQILLFALLPTYYAGAISISLPMLRVPAIQDFFNIVLVLKLFGHLFFHTSRKTNGVKDVQVKIWISITSIVIMNSVGGCYVKCLSLKNGFGWLSRITNFLKTSETLILASLFFLMSWLLTIFLLCELFF